MTHYGLTDAEWDWYQSQVRKLLTERDARGFSVQDARKLWSYEQRIYNQINAQNIIDQTLDHYNMVTEPLMVLLREIHPSVVVANPERPHGRSDTEKTPEQVRQELTATHVATGELTTDETAEIAKAHEDADVIAKLIRWCTDLATEVGKLVVTLADLATNLPDYLRLVNECLQILRDNRDAIDAGAAIVRAYKAAMDDAQATMHALQRRLKDEHRMAGDPYMPWPAPNFMDQSWTELYRRVQLAKGLPIVGPQITAMLGTLQQMHYQARTNIGYANTIDALASAPGISSGAVPGLIARAAGDIVGLTGVPAWFVTTEREFAASLLRTEVRLHNDHKLALQYARMQS